MGATPVEPVIQEEGINGDVEDPSKEYEEEEDYREGGMDDFVQTQAPIQYHLSRFDRLNPTNPLRISANSRRVAPRAVPISRPPPTLSQPPFPPSAAPILPQQSVTTLNPTGYTNRISLFLFILQTFAAIGLVVFLIFKGVQRILGGGDAKRKEIKLLKYFLPQAEAASLLSIALAFSWQMSVRIWPKFMVRFILWSSFVTTLSAGILLLCFEKPSTSGVGVAFLLFSIGNGLYACWVTQRTSSCTKVLLNSLQPLAKFRDLNRPTYWMMEVAFIYMSLWILAVIAALNFKFAPAIVIALGLSLAWTIEVMRNVATLTVSRVIALYYLRGIQSNTKFCFQRALSLNLGSASLGSLFVPSIEALRIIAMGLNLLEGEDEFLFSCAHCCLNVMQSVFKFGNGWAYVQVAAYGKSFTKASIDTWELFQKHSQEMEVIVDSDITSAICFLSGVCSGALCTIMAAAWTFKVHKSYTATISLLAFFVGYLMTRIAMALPHACVSCYYVCYAENPSNRLFDDTT